MLRREVTVAKSRHCSAHEHSQDQQSSTDSPFEMNQEELLVGDQRYIHDRDGSWENTGYAGDRGSAKWYCGNVARGTVRDLMPDMYTMISHAITERGDKKTVNGVRCREWKFDQRTVLSSRKVRYASAWTITCRTR